MSNVIISIDQIVDNTDATVTVRSHDQFGKRYENIIGLVSTPTPEQPTSEANLDYYVRYIQSTIPPEPRVLYSN